MRLALVLTLLAAASARASVTSEETVVAERLSAQANEFLVSLVGPGRGKAVVTVQGEQTNASSLSESFTPAVQKAPPPPQVVAAERTFQSLNELPGYNDKAVDQMLDQWKAADKRAAEAPPQSATTSENGRKSQQSSTWESGLEIKQIRVSVVLDNGVPQDKVAAVTSLLPKFLHLDSGRGDEMTVLRADLQRPNWKSVATGYLVSERGAGLIATLSGVLLLIMISTVLLRLTANSAIRTFVRELAAHRGGAGAERPSELPKAGPEAELLPGGMPTLDAEGEPAPAGGAATPLLGQRFDFLTARSPADLARLITKEPPEDLALLFATLSASHPDLSAAVFSSLDAASRAAVSRALASMTTADPDRLETLEARLKTLVDFGVRGAERLGEILSRLPSEERESLVRDVVSSNPTIADELERSLFGFEDIIQLRDSDFRRLIMAVPYADWGLALRGAPEPVVGRVLGELDPGPQGMLKEAMAAPQPRAKILEARSKIISQTLAMAARGEIAIRRGETTELI